jgi:hypothetical protein
MADFFWGDLRNQKTLSHLEPQDFSGLSLDTCFGDKTLLLSD